MNLLPEHPRHTHAVVIGAGTMGADVATVLARGGCRVTVTDPHEAQRAALPVRVRQGLTPLGLGARADRVQGVASLADVHWDDVVLVIECIPEQLALKQALFAELLQHAPAHCVLTSNSSSFPISAIAEGLPSAERMLGLHFFMPAHLVPLVEVVQGPHTDEAQAERLCSFMRGCGSVPVRVRKDKPGFLANRLQHALAREAFAMIDEGVATPEDVDAAVRFGFGFRYLAAGPVMQRDHAGLDVHCAAAATMYPSLAANTSPARALSERVAAGRLGMKTGGGFYDWPEERRLAERQRYDTLLQQGLSLLAAELPPIERD
ncbi:3-hydroxyacyl-CoA dehydrogenase NAD-binding domain-containing protein [Curvibacter sp. HBC61]|uniref:3-hydroxyacyl-CoA dehydrogenase NAD-binding domain-containing protein n=2 Tax=Curvibacter cyanobacteriorum TaxID=3026422 RepID=A0ABT5N1W9_9BURK|nr:3-hydroxyacyl-CoA dehydrogenase NAD-binding domain-containing protein [Curvibacter sp. HBC61]MDD0839047.1 3-hydroxyacyl-CoA dehydrogenase NAD-binding domain-containing protein [Curvibacter sp. HBC61]